MDTRAKGQSNTAAANKERGKGQLEGGGIGGIGRREPPLRATNDGREEAGKAGRSRSRRPRKNN